MVKQLRLFFDDEDHERLSKKKAILGFKNWESFFIEGGDQLIINEEKEDE